MLNFLYVLRVICCVLMLMLTFFGGFGLVSLYQGVGFIDNSQFIFIGSVSLLLLFGAYQMINLIRNINHEITFQKILH